MLRMEAILVRSLLTVFCLTESELERTLLLKLDYLLILILAGAKENDPQPLSGIIGLEKNGNFLFGSKSELESFSTEGAIERDISL